MRISDWSSDVCSSDLIAAKAATAHRCDRHFLEDLVRRTAIAIMILTTVPAAAFAQSGGSVDKRVGVLEKQMQAVQRKVFPGADPSSLEPEIAPATNGVHATGPPATTPLANLLPRVNTLERPEDWPGGTEWF